MPPSASRPRSRSAHFGIGVPVASRLRPPSAIVRRPAAPPPARSAIIRPRLSHPLVLLLATFAALATTYNVAVPVFEAPDEHLHYFVADHLARTGALPVQTRDPDARGPWEQEGSQPPLYYLLAAPLVRAMNGWLAPDDLRINDRNTMGDPARVGNENRFVHDPAAEGWPWHGYALGAHAVRALSTLLAAIAVAAIFGVARRAFDGPEADALALAVAALVAFNPQWLALSAAVTNDVLIAALAALALWLLARILDGECTWPTLIALAVVVGLAPLAKLSGLALLAFAVATLAWDGRRNRDVRYSAGRILLLCGSAAVLSGWWYARNLRLYGSPTGIDYMLVEGVGRDLNPERFVRGLPAELGGLWQSSWGIFGWFTVPLPGWALTTIAIASLLGLVGALAAVARRVPWLRRERAAWLGAWWLILFVSLLRWLVLVKGAHGRLLFPAIAAPAVLLVAGWRFWASALPVRARRRRVPGAEPPGVWHDGEEPLRQSRATPLAAATAVAMLALAALALLGVIRPAYAPPERIALADVPSSATRVGAVFDDRLRLVAYQVPPRATSGGVLPVTLYWQVTAPVTQDVFVALRVDQTIGALMGDGRLVDVPLLGEAALAYAGAGALPFDLVAPGDDVLVDHRRLAMPPLATSAAGRGGWPVDMAAAIALAQPVAGLPLRARLSIHVWEPATGSAWPITARSLTTAALGERDVVATFDLEAADRPSLPVGTAIARFDDAVVLAWPADGADARIVRVAAPSLRPTGAVSPALAVVWRVERDPNEAVQLLVHLLDAEGAMVAQFDGPPVVYGAYPTDAWRAGDVLPGRVAFDVPPGARPGDRFTLVVGLYGLRDGFPRLSAADSTGARLADDLVTLAEVVVTDEQNR